VENSSRNAASLPPQHGTSYKAFALYQNIRVEGENGKNLDKEIMQKI
jgi:hypothetical protein